MRTLSSLWVSLAIAIAAAGCQGEIPGTPTGGSGGASGAMPGAGGGGGGSGPGPGAAPGTSPGCGVLQPIPRRLWRLSVDQYANAVKDLLGLANPPAINTAGGTSAYAFFSPASADVDPTLQFNLYQTVQAVSSQIAPRISQIAACKPGEAEDACAARFIQGFGERAFRRPLGDDERQGLLAVYTEGRKQDFATGIRLTIEALLQAPSFIYRTELGGAPDPKGKSRLTGHEVATLLAFLLTDSMPDATLLAAADSGGLDSDQGVAAQVDRLLAQDRVKRNISQIVLRWFNVGQLVDKTKDPSLFAKLPRADQDQVQLKNDLLASALAFIDDVLWHGSGKVDELLTSRRIFVNQRLARLYGLPFTSTGAPFSPAEAPMDQQRIGIITQPAFLWALSDPAVTSIVKRGKFIHDDVLCVDPGPPPGSILDDPAVRMKLAMLPTEIAKSNYRLATPGCRECHEQIDPYALVLENFDAIGGWRTMADGLPVDPTGTFGPPSPLPAGRITGPSAFAQAVIGGKLLTACGVQKMASYAIGRMIRERATCETQQTAAAFEGTDGTMTSLIRQVATAGYLRVRSGGDQ